MSSPRPSEYDSHELRYLAELMIEFHLEDQPSPPDAIRQIETRYDRVMDDYPTIIKELLRKRDKTLASLLNELSVSLHALLFNGILSNAGCYRKSSDSHGGRVGFGGVRPQGHRSRFTGSPPRRIEKDLEETFQLLEEEGDPIKQSLRFYMSFNRVHPFYDANGRISRVLVSMYLYTHGMMVHWKRLDKRRNKFINKMNECHKRADSGYTYEKYLGYVFNFFRRYVSDIDALEETEDDRQ